MKPNVVVIGASTGGIECLRQIVGKLPAEFPAAVLIVLHVGACKSILPELLGAVSTLPLRHALDREPITPGLVLVAPPDHHLVVEDTHLRVLRGAKENFARPAIDPLFRSAAISHRERVIGVILSGDLDDGTVGLQAVKAYGGTAIVQDPSDALAPSMPRSAMEYAAVDFCLPVARIAETLSKLVIQPTARDTKAIPAEPVLSEYRVNLNELLSMEEMDNIGAPSGLTCPECHGGLWEITGAVPLRFRCHTGHAFTAASLNAEQERAVEEAIWSAVRALHEKEALLLRTAKNAADGHRHRAADEHVASAHLAARHAAILRKLLEQPAAPLPSPPLNAANENSGNGHAK